MTETRHFCWFNEGNPLGILLIKLGPELGIKLGGTNIVFELGPELGPELGLWLGLRLASFGVA